MIPRRGSRSNSTNADPGKRTRAFNKDLRYVQGFQSTLVSSGTVNVPIALNSSGRQLLGIAVIPITGTNADLTNTQLTLVVNNNNLLLNAATANLIPNYVQNMMFFPTPQPLSGNDVITIQITNNAATTPGVLINVYYVPQI
jgi:hypothetical protein